MFLKHFFNNLTANSLRSHIFIAESSPPLAMKGSFLFQFMTLTSLLCAFKHETMFALDGCALMSKILILLSTPQDAKTVGCTKQKITKLMN